MSSFGAARDALNRALPPDDYWVEAYKRCYKYIVNSGEYVELIEGADFHTRVECVLMNSTVGLLALIEENEFLRVLDRDGTEVTRIPVDVMDKPRWLLVGGKAIYFQLETAEQAQQVMTYIGMIISRNFYNITDVSTPPG
jgi:hypothetical protein